MKRVIKGNLILYFIILVIVVLTMSLIKRCIIEPKHPTRDYNEIANDTLRFVTNIYFDDISGSATLLNYEFAELIGNESGLVYKIDTVNSVSESIELLNLNDFDIIARPIFTTAESKNRVLFSDAISQENELVVVQRNDGEIKNNLDLGKKEISIIDDEGIKLIVNNIAYEIGDSINTNIEQNCSAEQLITMVADSTIDYAICGSAIAKRMKQFIPDINIDTKISIPLPQAWGVRLTSPILKDSLNLWIERVKISGKYRLLLNKYGI